MRFFSAILCYWLILFSASAQPVADNQCVVQSPRLDIKSDSDNDLLDQQPIRVSADRSEAISGDAARFEGKVRVDQGSRHVQAEKATVSQAEGHFTAEGDLLYQDPTVTITADSLKADISNSSAELNGTRYWLNNQQIHGKAERLALHNDNTLKFSNATFTTCPQEEPDWLLEAKKISIDANEEWGAIWQAKVKLFDVPIFHVPYMTVPVSDKRKTGLLFPQISTSSKNGVDFAQPYYWNIAPNLDATLTPQYMTSRGLFTRAETRYLQPYGQGRLNLEYIGSDRLLEEGAERYLIHFDHQGKLSSNWRTFAEFTHISDDNYFNDFDSAIGTSTSNQLNRELEAAYFSEFWSFSARIQDIDVLGQDERPFRVLPGLSFNYRRPTWVGPFDFDFDSELTHFAHRDSNNLTATRMHLEPGLSFPYQTPAGSVTAELKLLQTFYSQNDPDDVLDDFVSRTLPQFRVHSQINFERDINWFGNRYLQTLEPQAQYLFIPKTSQDDIGLYDTAALQEDYDSLFRDRRFSGLDRIADANQITLGVSTRFLDEENLERGRLALGQILYLSDSEISLLDNSNQISASRSALAAEAELQVSRRWLISSSLLFDTSSGDTRESEVLLDYKAGPNSLVQLSHRYVPDLGQDVDGNNISINQTGLRAAWPLSDEFYVVGNWYNDINLNRTIETYVGLQYESCCWAIRLAYHRNLNTNFEDRDFTAINPRNDFDSGISLQFVLKGLGSSGPLGISDLLDDGVFNYRRPYYLRN